MFLRSLDELTKHTSLKQWDPFLNYWTRTLGTKLSCESMLRDSLFGIQKPASRLESNTLTTRNLALFPTIWHNTFLIVLVIMY